MRPINTSLVMGLAIFSLTLLAQNAAISHVKDTVHTGVNNLSAQQNNTVVYPNPSTGQFTFQTTNVELGTMNVEIYNVLGEQVYSQLSNLNAQLSIDLSSKPDGVYLYKIVTEDGTMLASGRLIIRK
jgi:hypothetical protein